MTARGGQVRGSRAPLAVIAGLLCALAAAGPASAQAPGTLVARGSVEQVQVTGAIPGRRVKLLRRGETVGEEPPGELGGAVFRKVEPGGGYTVTQRRGDEPAARR